MAKAFGIEGVFQRGVASAAAELSAQAARAADLSRPLDRLGQHHVRKARRILTSGDRGISSRTRQLETSLTYAVTGNTLAVGSNKVYAGAQQFGPRGGFFESSRPGGLLAIPIADNLGARQQAKFNSPRDVPGGFFLRTPSGSLLFVRPRRRKVRSEQRRRSAWHKAVSASVLSFREQFEVLFLLVARVRGTAHLYVTHDGADQQAWVGYAMDWIIRGR